ncbi:MAG: TolC family protein [Candidatus Latescibacteria bacterium]|nr:TolC family protein [Candidatus Latescibacterota bacterium]
MRYFSNCILVAAAFSVLARVSAAQTPAAPSTIEDYLTIARANNAGVASSSALARAARERVGVATGFPDPSLLYGYYLTAPAFEHQESMDGRSELFLMQPVPFPGKRGLRGDVAAREADAGARAHDAVVLDLDYQVKRAFYQFVRVVEVESVLVQERALLRDMQDVTRVRESAGTAPQQDVLKLDLAIAELEDELTMVEHEDDRTRALLNELLGRDAHAPLPPPSWRPPDTALSEVGTLADSALVRRPEMRAAANQLAAAESSRRLAKREYWPDFVLGMKWEFGADMDDAWELMAGIDLPIWLGKRRAMVRAAEATQEAARYRLRADSLRVRREVEDAVHGVRSARERLERFETRILPRAEQTFRSSEAAYRAGRVEFIDYLDSQRTWLALRREYFGVIAELGMESAAFERAIAGAGVIEP